MAEKFQAPRGTFDVLPKAFVKDPEQFSHAWIYLEEVWQDVVEAYGYQSVRVPIFEEIELFRRSAGDTSDVVSKEMYEFTDKGDRHLALRPEFTAGVMRAAIENGMIGQGGIHRLYYHGPCFRYGRPGKGRYRQLHQLGMELIGSGHPLSDVEVLTAVNHFFSEIGLDVVFKINCIGRGETRARYGEVILNHVSSWLADQDEEGRAKARKNPLRLLDTKDDGLRSALDGLPPILDFLEPESAAHFAEIQRLLDQTNEPYEVDSSIVRGLDYYTDLVFEVVGAHLGSNSSLCGGGRYDELIETLGGKSTPSVGVGIGIERILITLAEEGLLPEEVPPLGFIVVPDGNFIGDALRLRQLLLDYLPAKILMDVEAKGMKQQLKAADRSGALHALIVGPEEVETETLTIKDLQTGVQNRIPIADALKTLLALIPAGDVDFDELLAEDADDDEGGTTVELFPFSKN